MRLMSITRCHCSSGISSAGAALAMPAQFSATESGPSCFLHSVNGLTQIGSSRDVAPDGQALTAQLL